MGLCYFVGLSGYHCIVPNYKRISELVLGGTITYNRLWYRMLMWKKMIHMHFRHLSYINEFYLQVNENAFTYERLGSRSGFEKKDNFFNPCQLLFTVRKLAYPTFTHDGNVFIRVKSLFMSQDSKISACLFVSCGKTHQTLSLSVLMETSSFLPFTALWRAGWI